MHCMSAPRAVGVMQPMVGVRCSEPWLTEEHHWRWVFFVNLPLGV